MGICFSLHIIESCWTLWFARSCNLRAADTRWASWQHCMIEHAFSTTRRLQYTRMRVQSSCWFVQGLGRADAAAGRVRMPAHDPRGAQVYGLRWRRWRVKMTCLIWPSPSSFSVSCPGSIDIEYAGDISDQPPTTAEVWQCVGSCASWRHSFRSSHSALLNLSDGGRRKPCYLL